MNTETTFSVPSIVCSGCVGGIKKALDKVPGINLVGVDVNTKVVTVKHDEKVTRQNLAEVLDGAGFPAR